MNASTSASITPSDAPPATPNPDRAPDRAPSSDERTTTAPSKLPPWRCDALAAASVSASTNSRDIRRDGGTAARNVTPLKQFLLKNKPRLVDDGQSPTNSPSRSPPGSPAGSPEPKGDGNGTGAAVAPAAEDHERGASPGPRGGGTVAVFPVPDAVVAPAAADNQVDEIDEDGDDFELPAHRTVTSRASGNISSTAVATDPASCAPVPPRLRVSSLSSSSFLADAPAQLSPHSPLSSFTLSPTTPVSPPPVSAAAAAAQMPPPAAPASASPAPSRVRQQLYFQRSSSNRNGAGKYMPAHCLVCDACVSEHTTPGTCKAHARGQSCELAQDRADVLTSAGAAINLTTLTPSCRAFLETSRYWTDIVRHTTRMAESDGTDAAFSITLCRKRCYPQWTRRKAIDGVPIKRRPRKKPAAERDLDGDAADGEFAQHPMPPRKRPRRSTRPDWVAPSLLPPPPSPAEPVRRSTLPPPLPPSARARPTDPAPLMARARTRDRAPPPPPPSSLRAPPSAATARASTDHDDDDDDMDVDVETTTPKRIDPPVPLFAPPAMPQDPLFALVAGQMYVARTMMQVETMRARLVLRERLHAMGYSKKEVEKEIAGSAATGLVGMGVGMGMMPGTDKLGAGGPFAPGKS
ncbi:hypothetical protein AMAG_06563 [Allomyces macrogynus ATCC 38327]|uniref:Uncharacterized protein n=1 Tax=Allomyces macrogynus (strain ATCC 38327) TaxID=578462 RepID=A0A0L0SGX4_ALLM3|nr:hypothetical protein AMAG_06563 [Allomyces macrogynus ATCC 38327]|eukprot:KNE61763.1 hypothetical protein AMAG_06563 [Allomyces macrogynus ATCC 38327]